MTEPLRYFAFGANMNSAIFQGRRGIRPLSVEAASLSGWQLVFEQPGVPLVEPVFATLTEQAGETVYGVLYGLTLEDVERLNRTEGEGYSLVNLQVQGEDSGEVEAFTYTSRTTLPGHKPSRTYLRKMIEGATEHALPDEYIARLSAVDTVHVPLLSWLFDHYGRVIIRMAANGKMMNNRFVRLGADFHHDR